MTERRYVARTRIRRIAEIVVIRRGVAKVQVTLHDLTSTGACLTLAGTYSIVPDTFDLTFDQGRSCRPCRVKWRSGDRLGVSFEKPDESSVE
jgi:PilZ domain